MTTIDGTKSSKNEASKAGSDAEMDFIHGLVDGVDHGVGIWNSDNILIAHNAQFREVLSAFPRIENGMTFMEAAKELAETGKIANAVGKEDKWAKAKYKEFIAELGKEITYQTHDGKWISRTDRKLDNGGILSIRKDVTNETVRTEKIESQELLVELAAAAFNNLSAAVVIRDENLVYRLANDRFAEIYGKPIDEVIGKTAVELFGKDVASSFDPGNLKVIKNGKPYELEENLTFPDGREMLSRTEVKRITTSSGKHYAAITITDVTDLHSREKALKEKTSQLSLIAATLKSLPSAVMIRDSKMRYQMVNGRFCELLGKNEAEMINKTTQEVFGEKFGDEFDKRDHEIIRTGEPLEFEETFVTSKGEEVSAITSVTRLEDSDGQYYICVTLNEVTEIRNREKKLATLAAEIENSKTKIQSVAEASSDYFWEMNQDLLFSSISPEYEVITGVSEDLMIAKGIEALNPHHMDKAELDRAVAAFDNLETFRDVTYAVKKDNGEVVWISASGAPQFSADGTFEGYVGVGRDVTANIAQNKALEKANKQVENSKIKIQSIAETGADWFWEMDANLRFSSLSKNITDVLGVDPKNLIGKSRVDLWAGDPDEPEFVAHLKLLDEKKIFRNFIYPLAAKTGSKEWISISGTPDFDTEGNFLGYLGTGRVVTDEVERLELLAQSKREIEEASAVMNEAATAMAQGLMIFGPQEIEFVSDKAQEFLGLPEDILKVGNTWKSYFDEQIKAAEEKGDLDIVERAKASMKALAENRRHRVERRSPSGLYLSIDAEPRVDGGAVITISDVTEQKEHEAELERAQKAAHNADRAKSEFLANMSHEIRTPMNGVMGMAELLAKTELSAKQKMFTDVIVKSGASLLTIINDILDFSKLEAGQMELDVAPFSLAEAIEDVATLVSSRVAEKDLELIVRVDPKLPDRVVGDVGRIRQIITNLMGNAVKFTEMGHVYVNVKNLVKSGAEDNQLRLRFEIEDTGIGIPEDKCRSVFEKFSQADTSSSRKHEGTGLGLTICSSLVEIMGGEIGVYSQEGKGSTFWFEIDIQADEQQTKRQRVPMDVTGARILIVDDNAVNRSILSEQMAAWQFDSAAAVDGFEALAVMRAAKEHNVNIDCVILDYHMPEMNGGDVVRQMRDDPALADIPVVMLTSVDQTEDGKVFSSLGIEAHLTKPARSSYLLETIIEILEQNDFQKNQSDAVAVEEASPPAEIPEVPHSRLAEETVEEVAEIVDLKPTTQEEGSHHQLDVLVCEDNQVNQIVFTQILESIGFSFQIASNGKAGVEMAKAQKPKIILMDVSMPEMNGLEATGAIRQYQQEHGGYTPIIGVTAHAIKGDMEKCLEAGMDDYLSKPISPDALEKKIRHWMENVQAVQNG